MKILSSLFLLLMIGTMCLASSIATVPTVTLGLQQSNLSSGFSTASYTYFGGSVEIPTGKGQEVLIGVNTGNNYGVSSMNYALSYKFEIK